MLMDTASYGSPVLKRNLQSKPFGGKNNKVANLPSKEMKTPRDSEVESDVYFHNQSFLSSQVNPMIGI